jgi:hypothetical protein
MDTLLSLLGDQIGVHFFQRTSLTDGDHRLNVQRIYSGPAKLSISLFTDLDGMLKAK